MTQWPQACRSVGEGVPWGVESPLYTASHVVPRAKPGRGGGAFWGAVVWRGGSSGAWWPPLLGGQAHLSQHPQLALRPSVSSDAPGPMPWSAGPRAGPSLLRPGELGGGDGRWGSEAPSSEKYSGRFATGNKFVVLHSITLTRALSMLVFLLVMGPNPFIFSLCQG